ncbi:DUF5810 domain-containing protein [Halorarius halobius]|uniref:DUF5810 domain-containing protein n=1 Tax=Halorarius halobius TaxID=2962671 RepID=UPI0020CF94B8|nr:DUF5810 domain-containing protein [Halorarius halobius]
MGYACPVCGDPQADARHLANHLAFTAMLGREDHEAWLDDHAPGWEQDGERELAERVADHADDSEYPQVFEDTAGGLDDAEADDERSGALFDHEGHDHDHRGAPDHLGSDHGGPADPSGYEQADVPRDPETQEVLEEARELTQEMLAEDDEETEDADTEDADIDGGGTDDGE